MLPLHSPAPRRRRKLFVGEISSRAVVYQELNCPLVAIHRRPMQPRSAKEAAEVHVGAALQERTGNLRVTIAASDVEGVREGVFDVLRRRLLFPVAV